MSALYAAEIIRVTRNNFLTLVEKCTLEEVNRIPAGFNNNLAWNLVHILSSQQVLCYELSGITPVVEPALIDAYRPGTRPEKAIDETELSQIKELLKASVDRLKEDYTSGIFKQYIPRQTRYGVLINNIDEAIPYVALHEGLHFGYAKAMYTIIKKENGQ